MTVQSINPATGEVIETFTPHTDGEVDAALARADTAFRAWRKTPFAERAALLRRTAERLEAREDELARAMTREMGKRLAEAKAEVRKCAWVCRHYADQGEAYLADEPAETEARRAFVRHLPLGPVLAVMPWNFPLWQVFRFAAPTLMAGNVGLLKHASNVWRCALLIEGLFRDAGAPEGVFQALRIGGSDVARVIEDRRVRAVTLTGSEPAGSAVAVQAGRLIKPSVLELGGSDAFIVMPSADFEPAVSTAIEARVMNNGQSCIAAKRFIIHDDIYDRFRDAFVARFDELTVGDPMAAGSDLGPLAMAGIRDDLSEQVKASCAAGARRLSGGHPLPAAGFYLEPCVLEAVPDGSPAAQEELFGPVAALWRVASLNEAIRRANATRFGLGSAIFTSEPAEIAAAVDGLEAGSTFVNAKVASDPRLPFGGIGASGYGRELAADGIRAFVNRKTVSVA